MNDIYNVLEELKINYEKHEHPAVFTVEEAQKYDRGINAGKSKNLFLRNKKGDRHYLVIVEATRMVDLKKLAIITGESKLSFASAERLNDHLGVTPGSVSPFGLINDSDKTIQVVVDNGLLKYDKLAFHPNINTATLVISADDFKKFLDSTSNNVIYELNHPHFP